MTTFLLVRHGEPDWGINQDLQLKGAQRDFVPLTDVGIHQAMDVAKELQNTKPDIVISSPYTRALHTAAIISRELNLPIQVEYGLHEWIPDLSLQYDSLEQLAELAADYEQNGGCVPNGEHRLWETKDSILARVEKSLSKYTDYHTVVVVTHGMVMRSLTNVEGELEYCQTVSYLMEEEQNLTAL